MHLRFARLAYPVTALGPGRRLALWVAGCSLRCHGCITPELQSADAGKAIPVARLAERILALNTALDGITLTGGEPFEQAEALAELWASIAPQRPEWDLLAFSGYTLAQLQARPNSGRLLAFTDLLVAGPFLPQRPSQHPLLASGNQQLHDLTPRGRRMMIACDESSPPRANLGYLGDGRGWLVGLLDPDERRSLHRRLGSEE